jgi:hypothetical protein
MLFTPIVLVCLASQARDACTKTTAADLFYGEPSKNEIMCNFYGQAALAGTSIGQGLRDGEWVKIVCERSKEGDH